MKSFDNLKVRGVFRLGNMEHHNLVVYGGYDSLCEIMAAVGTGNAEDLTSRLRVALCSGDVDAPTRSDTELQGTRQAEVAVDSSATVDSAEHSVTYSYSVPAGTVSGTTYVTEAGLFWDGVLFSRVVFSDPVEVSSLTEMDGSWKIIFGDDSVPSGTGTEDDPYLIANSTQLDWFCSHVNGGETGACAALIANITYNAGVDVAGYDGKSTVSWDAQTPICTASSGYTGTFDGRGNTISGLYINTADYTRAGLFGYIGSAGVVKDVYLTNYYIASSYVGASEVRVGSIAGESAGTVSGCKCSGTVDITADCSGSEVETIFRCGGIAGYNAGTASDNTMSGSVDVSGTATSYIRCGGIAGTNSATASTSDNTMSGSVDVSGTTTGSIYCGGIVGYNTATASDNTMSGSVDVSGTATGSIYCGGIVGYNSGTGYVFGNSLYGSYSITGSGSSTKAAAIIAGGTTSGENIYDNYDYTTEAAVAAASVSAE